MSAARAALLPWLQAVIINLLFGISERRLSSWSSGTLTYPLIVPNSSISLGSRTSRKNTSFFPTSSFSSFVESCFALLVGAEVWAAHGSAIRIKNAVNHFMGTVYTEYTESILPGRRWREADGTRQFFRPTAN